MENWIPFSSFLYSIVIRILNWNLLIERLITILSLQAAREAETSSFFLLYMCQCTTMSRLTRDGGWESKCWRFNFWPSNLAESWVLWQLIGQAKYSHFSFLAWKTIRSTAAHVKASNSRRRHPFWVLGTTKEAVSVVLSWVVMCLF